MRKENGNRCFLLLEVWGLICSMNSSCLLSVIAFCSLYSTIFIPGELILELSSGAGERKSCQAQSAFPEEIRPRGTGGNGRQEQTALIPCRNCVQRRREQECYKILGILRENLSPGMQESAKNQGAHP